MMKVYSSKDTHVQKHQFSTIPTTILYYSNNNQYYPSNNNQTSNYPVKHRRSGIGVQQATLDDSICVTSMNRRRSVHFGGVTLPSHGRGRPFHARKRLSHSQNSLAIHLRPPMIFLYIKSFQSHTAEIISFATPIMEYYGYIYIHTHIHLVAFTITIGSY